MPSKSGVVGLLAAAQGRPRGADIADLVGLRMGVRVDVAGSVLRDYHTVSDFRGLALSSASVLSSGLQKRTSPAKYTHVTERLYLQDATFVAAVEGPTDLVATLSEAVTHPIFPLSLGRRSCVPSQPLVISDGPDRLWRRGLREVLESAPWQVSLAQARRLRRPGDRSRAVSLAVTVEVDTDGNAEIRSPDSVVDVPTSFEPRSRGFTARTVEHAWVSVKTPFAKHDLESESRRRHDPFDLLGED